MHALPAVPAPPRRRQLLVGTALVAAAGAMAVAGQLGLWMQLRDNAGGATPKWLPKGVVVNEVAANTMLVTLFAASLMAQWAVYSVKRGDRRHTAYALALTGVMGVAVIVAQARIYDDMAIKVAQAPYGPLFYGVTGTFLFLMAIGLGFCAVAAVRALGGRTASEGDREVVSANALWFHALSVVFCFVWFVVYAVK
jgi:cytochrome c oxidase subunit 3